MSGRLHLVFIYYTKKTSRYWNLPEGWKMAYVVRIHKGDSKKDANNYRPILLTSTPCKILEHVLYKDIMKLLFQQKLLAAVQHGFGRACLAKRNLMNPTTIY